MTTKEAIKEFPKGTWIRALQNGKLVIKSVEYVQKGYSSMTQFSFHLVVDDGLIEIENVLEKRLPQGINSINLDGCDSEVEVETEVSGIERMTAQQKMHP